MKILITCFPATVNEQVKDLDFNARIPYKQDELLEFQNFVNENIKSIDLGTTIASGAAGYDPNVLHAYVVQDNFCSPTVGGTAPCNNATNANARQFTVPTWGGAAWWASQGFTGGVIMLVPSLARLIRIVRGCLRRQQRVLAH